MTAAMRDRWNNLHHAILTSSEMTSLALRAKSAATSFCLSGASDGADTLFGEGGLKAGHEVIHFLGPRNDPSAPAAESQSDSLVSVSDEVRPPLSSPGCTP